MLQRVGNVSHDVEIRNGNEDSYGDYNGPFPNMKEITVAEFAQSIFFSYDPVFIGHKQILPNRLKGTGIKALSTLTVTYFVFHNGTGIVLHSDYWQKKIRYFSFAVCEHIFRQPTEKEIEGKIAPRPARCYHVSVCKKCGYVEAVDSSD